MLTFKIPRRHSLRGAGLGRLFSRLGSFLTPLIKSGLKVAKPIARRAAKELGKTALQTASNAMVDIAAGTDPHEAIKRNLKEGIGEAKQIAKKGAKKTYSSVKRQVKRQRGGSKTYKKRARKMKMKIHESRQKSKQTGGRRKIRRAKLFKR